jgi:uncharacterized OB-fold protein
MKNNLTGYLKDCSTSDEFRFAIRCEECGNIWYSTPVRFSKAGVEPATDGKKMIYRVLYEKEKEQAAVLAEREGKEIFSTCPVCGKLVCDRCFMICDEVDMCRRCATMLKERGEPVMEKKPKTSAQETLVKN